MMVKTCAVLRILFFIHILFLSRNVDEDVQLMLMCKLEGCVMMLRLGEFCAAFFFVDILFCPGMSMTTPGSGEIVQSL